MNTKIFFIRHAQTKKDPNVNASNWVLSNDGIEKAESFKNYSTLQNVEKIYASSEIKTVQTIEPLAKKLDKEVIQIDLFDEVRRGDKYLTNEEFEIEKFKQLEDLDYPAFGGETAREALKRFEKGVKKVASANKGKVIIIVSHGTILNLYFAKLLNRFFEIKERWQNTSFGAVGVTIDDKVTSDIVILKEKFSNIEKFAESLGLVVTYSTKSKISFEFKDSEEIDAAESEFSKIISDKNSSDKDYDRVWELRFGYERKFYPKIFPMIEKLNQFYQVRKTPYKYQLFFYTKYLFLLSLGPIGATYDFFQSDSEYVKKIYQELQDFDKFLESQ